ncbi:MAG TPA: hypothetical protein VFJ13_00865, partial [Paracoccaceae bacterium]|nr:hypothetical protein [Paracoccaceae bacterium]
AVAASFLVAAIIASFAFLGPTATVPAGDRNSVLALHSEFAALPSQDLPPRALAGGPGHIPPPDLSASNLRLFATRRAAGAAVGYHYRGPNGCRVTLVIGAALELPDAALARQWPVGEQNAVLIADGMDPRRFAAVAAYAEAATRGPDPAERLRIALIERTASARPCA